MIHAFTKKRRSGFYFRTPYNIGQPFSAIFFLKDPVYHPVFMNPVIVLNIFIILKLAKWLPSSGDAP